MRAFIVFLLCLTGCGYRFQKPDERMTLSIPYVKGDQEGQLTNELIRQFARSGAYEYLREDGDLLLKVALVGASSEKIGFRYDRNQTTGAVETNLMPTENRRTATAEVSLVHAGTEEVVAGPYKIAASVDYDYTDVNSIQALAFVTPTGQKEKVLNYSLGQVDSPEGAHDDATLPLYRNLAQQIVAAVLNQG
jgi:hypothetical protein